MLANDLDDRGSPAGAGSRLAGYIGSGHCCVLICVGDPRKGGIHWLFRCLALFRPVLGAVDRRSGSRWSARSAARTNDLEADEDPPQTVVGRDEAKDIVGQVICCLP